jgi:hypothetical protein
VETLNIIVKPPSDAPAGGGCRSLKWWHVSNLKNKDPWTNREPCSWGPKYWDTLFRGHEWEHPRLVKRVKSSTVDINGGFDDSSRGGIAIVTTLVMCSEKIIFHSNTPTRFQD